jgi:hypothetical protein
MQKVYLQVKVDKTLGDIILKSVKQILAQVVGACPKRKVCSFFQKESITCISGPYPYCGKYRSIVEPKNKNEIVHQIA